MEFVIAELMTPNYRFEAVGTTQEAAFGLLERAWHLHFEELGRPDDMLSFDAVVAAAEDPASPYVVRTRCLQVGQAYRDGVRVS